MVEGSTAARLDRDGVGVELDRAERPAGEFDLDRYPPREVAATVLGHLRGDTNREQKPVAVVVAAERVDEPVAQGVSVEGSLA